jgi:uncharacterized lipoprotein YajG
MFGMGLNVMETDVGQTVNLLYHRVRQVEVRNKMKGKRVAEALVESTNLFT